MSEPPDKLYDQYYYDHYSYSPYDRESPFMPFFAAIAGHIVEEIGPRTALDAGCAKGFLVENLRKLGVEAFGIDISEYAVQNVHPDIAPYCRVASILEPLPQAYDLIVCLEVAEHLPAGEAGRVIANLCAHTRDVIFSSTPDEYKDATHFNVQPLEYWVEIFARHGFHRDVDYDASYIAPWAIRFRKTEDNPARIMRGYERKFWQYHKEITALRSLAAEQYARIGELEKQSQAAASILASTAPPPDNRAAEELKALQSSGTWKMLMQIHRMRRFLIPAGSRRERLLYRLTGRG